MAALDLHDGLLSPTALVVEEVDITVDPFVGTLSFLGWASAYKTKCPYLELVTVLLRKRLRTWNVLRITDDLVGRQLLAKGVLEAVPYKRDREVSDVDPYPAPMEPLGDSTYTA